MEEKSLFAFLDIAGENFLTLHMMFIPREGALPPTLMLRRGNEEALAFVEEMKSRGLHLAAHRIL